MPSRSLGINIALDNFFRHAFLPAELAQLFVFWLLPYYVKQHKSQQNNVLQEGRSKKPAWRQTGMTEKITDGHGHRGAAPKNAGAKGRFLGAAGINLPGFRMA